MMPLIPPKLAPWIEFGNNTAILKPNAPEAVKPDFEKLLQQMQRADREALNELPII
ncbi:hypothetical protein SAMN04487969_11961 [Paenibacillus algorifonticola]|uniref:Uncharacterized protein n=1 Tax=Paenibacillus algorifonticola TaxID=684063 RepID=A0A1I2H2D0_9BACL|nr:hypothetical protein [Paenibacillus algorifonticola]SFF22976.1 hypothetical protein SAMN04487969_11961 [Paenibacillus algorifonticola]